VIGHPLVSPEVSEPIGRQVGVADRVDDVPVAEVVLDRPRVVPVIRELVAARMPQGKLNRASLPALATIFRTPESVSGPRRSVLKT
jgi:hypothetical protein